MTDTYSDFSDVCTKFYDLVVNPLEVAQFVYSIVEEYQPKNCLFVGGFFLVAKELKNLGLTITLTDYTEQMIREAKIRLPETRIEMADLRELPFEKEFDAVFVIGRVFTHMFSADDSSKALQSIAKTLKPGGIVLLDNYEDTKIQVTDYFNGRVAVSDESIKIERLSNTELVSKDPYIVNWSAEYIVSSEGSTNKFQDEMPHRAFSRKEMKEQFEENGFTVLKQGDNFDETSFYTLASIEAQ